MTRTEDPAIWLGVEATPLLFFRDQGPSESRPLTPAASLSEPPALPSLVEYSDGHRAILLGFSPGRHSGWRLLGQAWPHTGSQPGHGDSPGLRSPRLCLPGSAGPNRVWRRGRRPDLPEVRGGPAPCLPHPATACRRRPAWPRLPGGNARRAPHPGSGPRSRHSASGEACICQHLPRYRNDLR